VTKIKFQFCTQSEVTDKFCNNWSGNSIYRVISYKKH